MTELMISLMAWLGTHSAYGTEVHLPNIAMLPQHNMCRIYGVDDKARCDALGLKGFYDKRLTIYMRMDFDPENMHHQSQLLHELVHYLQWSSGEADEHCLGHLELEAYELQDAWRVEQGLQPVLADFNRLMLEISCSA